jgi:hypothetical protein
MKRFYFSLILISFILVTSASFSQKSPMWSTPQCRNYNGGTPEQPTTIYLGDQGTFGCDSWGDVDGQWPDWKVVIHTGSDVSSGTYGAASSIINYVHKTGTSPRFSLTGTWYWGIQVHYGDAGYSWYCRNNSSYYNMWGIPASDLTVTVSALSDPTSPTATQSSISQINLGWSKWNSKNVMIVRRLTSAAASNAPTQGTAYTVGVGAPQLGTGTVVYNSSGTSLNDTGLTPGTSYTYTLYSENFSYYSPGATASASTVTQTSAATDNFKSKSSGNWSTAGNWESSPDNTNWISSTLSPDVSAATIKVLSGHNITLDANVTIPGLTINSGGTFTASDGSARTLTITKSTSGNVTTLLNSGTWNNGTGGSTVVFTGTPNGTDAVHSISGTIGFQNITLNKTGGSANVGASFGTLSSVSGTLEIGTGGFVSTSPPVGFYSNTAVLKFNQGSGAIYNVNSSDNSWSTSQIPQYITISSGTVNLNNARTAAGNLIIDGGTLWLGAPLTIQQNWTRSSGTFTANSQTVTLSGATNTIIDAIGGATLYDLTVSKTGGAYVSLSSNLTVSHNLLISSGAVLTIPSAKALTVDGSFTNSSTAAGIVVESGGSLITKSTVSGSATIKREIASDNKWHFISSPVSGQNICDGVFAPLSGNFTSATGATYDFYKWSEPIISGNLNWLNLKKSDWSLNTTDFGATPQFGVGTGYLVAYASGFAGNATKSFAGTLTSGDQTIGLTTGGNTYNLIGNPFSSAIDWDGVTKTSLAVGYYYVYNQAKAGGAGYEEYLDGTHKTSGANGKISAAQGFFVDASGSSLVLPNAARVHDNNWMKSSQSAPVDQLKLTMGNATNYDEAFIQFETQGTTGKDFFDAEKMFSLDSEIPQLYSVVEDNTNPSTNISINSMPYDETSFSIPVGVFIPADGSYTLNVSGIESFGLTPSIVLQDLKLNTTQDIIANPIYGFTASTNDNPVRFVLTFNAVTVGTNEPSIPAALRIYAHACNIYLSGSTGKSEVYVRNMLGQTVMLRSVNSNGLEVINAASLKAGIYVVSVVNSVQTISTKVIIK